MFFVIITKKIKKILGVHPLGYQQKKHMVFGYILSMNLMFWVLGWEWGYGWGWV